MSGVFDWIRETLAGARWRAWFAVGAVVVAVPVAIVANGSVRWALLGFGGGTALGLLRGGGTGAQPWRWPGVLLPVALVIGLATSTFWAPLHIGTALVVGLVVGWAAVSRSFPASSPLYTSDLAAAAVAIGTIAVTQGRTAGTLASSLFVAGALLSIAAAAWIFVAFVRRLATHTVSGPSPASTYRWFLGACICVLATLLIGSRDIARITDDDLRLRVGRINGAAHGIPEATVAVLRHADAAGRDDMLIRTYAPRLFLPSDQAAWPHHSWVDVLESEIVDLDSGTTTRPHYTPDDREWVPTSCRYPRGASCVISDKCFEDDPRCAPARGSLEWPYGIWVPPGGDTSTHYLRPYGVLYARMLHRGGDSLSDSKQQTQTAFERAESVDARFGKRITDVIQYWVYYRYDRWRADTALGALVQEHESDWEPITVGLSDGDPLFVAYGSHCGGQWLDWNRVPAVRNSPPEEFILSRHAQFFPNSSSGYLGLIRTGKTERTHSAVMVAAGSQGNYPASARFRVADWTSCPFGRSFGDVISAAVSLRETLELGQEVVPAEIFIATRWNPPMSYGGHWGVNSKMELAGITFRGGEDSPGPPAPPRQDIWKQPLVQIFHSSVWHEGPEP